MFNSRLFYVSFVLIILIESALILIVPDVIRSKIFFHLGHKTKIISTLFHFCLKYRYFTASKYSYVRERVETLIATSLKLRVVVPSPLLILVIYVSSV